MKNLSDSKDYLQFLTDIKERIRNAQYEALKKVNKEQLQLNWEIGKMLVEKKQKLGWGKSVVEQLAKDLQKEFVGISGFSARNLWRMKMFFESYSSKNQFLPPLVAEIGWSHNIVILVETQLPEKWKEFLPTPEQIEKHFKFLTAL